MKQKQRIFSLFLLVALVFRWPRRSPQRVK